MEVRLFAFADQIKRIAGGHAHGFVARRVINRVLADELQLPVAIAAIKAQFAGGQRDAKLVGLGVLELALDDDFFVVALAVALVVVQAVELKAFRAVININRGRIHFPGVNKFHLLRLVVVQRGRARDGIQMKLVEGFLGDRRRGIHGGHRHRHGLISKKSAAIHIHRLDFIRITGHELDAGVLKRLAAVVIHRNPADEVAVITFLRRDEIVAGAPVKAGGDVTDLSVKFSRLVGLQ